MMITVIFEVRPAFGSALVITMAENVFSFAGDIKLAQPRLYRLYWPESEFKLYKDDYQSLIGDIEKLKLTAMPPYNGGLDGITFTLKIINGSNESSFKWWVKCPEEWTELDRLGERLLVYAKKQNEKLK
jgi:hypothetical protein